MKGALHYAATDTWHPLHTDTWQPLHTFTWQQPTCYTHTCLSHDTWLSDVKRWLCDVTQEPYIPSTSSETVHDVVRDPTAHKTLAFPQKSSTFQGRALYSDKTCKWQRCRCYTSVLQWRRRHHTRWRTARRLYMYTYMYMYMHM
jgi:hypothetical protein